MTENFTNIPEQVALQLFLYIRKMEPKEHQACFDLFCKCVRAARGQSL